MPARKRSDPREGVERGRNRGAAKTEGRGPRAKVPRAAERIDGDVVPGGRDGTRGLVSHPAERTGRRHIRGGGLGIEPGLLRHEAVEVHRPHRRLRRIPRG